MFVMSEMPADLLLLVPMGPTWLPLSTCIIMPLNMVFFLILRGLNRNNKPHSLLSVARPCNAVCVCQVDGAL